MPYTIANRVQETTSTSGTGTLNLNGAIAGFQSFVTGVGTGSTTSYVIYDPTANVWEAGIGTVTAGSPNTLARTQVLSNSSGTTSQINLVGNTSNVWCDYLAERSVTQFDVGTQANQIPLNQYLGTMAWQDVINYKLNFVINTDVGTAPNQVPLNQYLGTMAWQDASAIKVLGGAIDNTAIGSVTPSTGAFTTVSATGVITSTLATGTAPFTIASTTNVPNLNASSLNGATFASPGAIGGTTASTGQFTTGAFGGTQSTAQQLLIGGNSQTASITEYGVNSSQVVQSAVTTLYCGFNTSISTQATAFTASNIRHYQAGGFAVGSGSTVTNNVAFYIGAGLTGSTNTYGVFSALASASGTWNLYLGGTADNYMAGRLGIGTTSLAGSQVTIGGNSQVDSTTEYGVNNTQTVQSAVTSAYYGYRTGLGTQATTFTLSQLSNFIAQQGTFGSGSTVTTQAGFHVATNMTGATNNYGLYSNLALASGTFNLYIAGTASNYIAGSLGIGTAVVGSTASSLVVKGITAVSASAPTIASATTIAPTTSIVFISGTTPIATITAPSPISLGGGQITLIPTGIFTTTTAGNIALASTAVVSKALIMTYDATTTKWYPSY